MNVGMDHLLSKENDEVDSSKIKPVVIYLVHIQF